jgi:hypothetical protein
MSPSPSPLKVARADHLPSVPEFTVIVPLSATAAWIAVEPLTGVFPFSATVPPVMLPPPKLLLEARVSLWPALRFSAPPLRAKVPLKVGLPVRVSDPAVSEKFPA